MAEQRPVRPVVVQMRGAGTWPNWSIMGVDGKWWAAKDGRRRRWSTMARAEAALAAETAMQVPGPELPLSIPPRSGRPATGQPNLVFHDERAPGEAPGLPDEEDEEPTPYRPTTLSRDERARRLAERHGLTASDADHHVRR